MSDPLFIPAPFFMFRAPFWSLQKWEEFISQKDWVDAIFNLYDSDPIFQEALSLASTSLYQLAKQKKLKKNQANGAKLLKFALRMSSRTIPFGLFAFISIGRWSNSTDVEIDTDKIQKHARPDLTWVYNLIQKLYSDPQLFSKLSVYTNPLISHFNERFLLSYLRKKSESEKMEQKVASINATLLTKSILKIAKNGIRIEDLYHQVSSIICNDNPKKLEEVIKELYSQQFLLPSLLPSLLSPSPFEDLLSKLPDMSHLEEVQLQLQQYQQTFHGKGVECLDKIETNMKKIVQADNYIQVDTAYFASEIKISSSVAQEAAKAASLLWKLTTKNHNENNLQGYHKKFIEKYGTTRSVPLLEMLCPNRGIGPYETTTGASNHHSKTPFQNNFEKWLKLEAFKFQNNKSAEIILTHNILEALEKKSNHKSYDFSEALTSTDLFCEIIASSQKEIDEGNFLLVTTHPSWQGGGTFGRFTYLYDKKTKSELQEYFSNEEALEPHSIFMETSCWPITGNQANVSNHPSMRLLNLDLGKFKSETQNLTLEDIYVTADIENFYLTLKNGEKRIFGYCENLLVSRFMPNPIQFIRAVTLSNKRVIEPVFWGKLEDSAEFLPRIRYGKSILSVATWFADPLLVLDKKNEQTIKQFILWAKRVELPNKCFQVLGDQHLLIDWSHPACLEEIAKELHKGSRLKFIEYMPNNWCMGNTGMHLSEIVIPLLKNPVYTHTKEKHFPSYLPINHQTRVKGLGSEWISVKLYLAQADLDHFLVNHFFPFYQKLLMEENVMGLFFVRYHDPDFHIRLRIRLESENQFATIVQLIRQVTIDWSNLGILNRYEFVSYEREIERYGGLDLIEIIEALFCADSNSVIPQITDLTSKDMPYPRQVYLVWSVITFLNGLMLSDDEKLLILKVSEDNKHLLKGYREYKGLLQSSLKALNTKEEGVIPQSIFYSYKQRADLNHILCNYLKKLNPNIQMTICSSLLHMHCNRLGCNRQEEIKTYAYAHQALQQEQTRNALENKEALVSI